jgi:LysM repeat protein
MKRNKTGSEPRVGCLIFLGIGLALAVIFVGCSSAPIIAANKRTILQVVDDESGIGIPKSTLQVRTPDNLTKQYETNPSGLIELPGMQSGVCELSSDLQDATKENTLVFVGIGNSPVGKPVSGSNKLKTMPEPKPGKKYRIAVVEDHKVKTGETLRGLAEKAGISLETLTIFNWGTDNPDEINKNLHRHVGCKKKDADGNYIFNDDDKPGIIYVPKRLMHGGLAVNQIYTIRVRRIVGALCVRLDVNPEEAKSDDTSFKLFSTDKTYEQIKTIQNDSIPGTDYVDLIFDQIPLGSNYSLEIDPGKNIQPYLLFEDIPYDHLGYSRVDTENNHQEQKSPFGVQSKQADE